jgi:hypothetical protein
VVSELLDKQINVCKVTIKANLICASVLISGVANSQLIQLSGTITVE